MTVTPFAQAVYHLTKKVPQGRVTTYKEIAKALHCRAYQAVGQALARNPFAPIVPCHRVVKSNGTIGGFGGKTRGKKIKKKIRILEKEGIKFTGQKIRNFKKVFLSIA